MSGQTASLDASTPAHRWAPYEARVHQQLLQWGLSPQGLEQLTQGRMPTAAEDRRLVARLVAEAARG